MAITTALLLLLLLLLSPASLEPLTAPLPPVIDATNSAEWEVGRVSGRAAWEWVPACGGEGDARGCGDLVAEAGLLMGSDSVRFEAAKQQIESEKGGKL